MFKIAVIPTDTLYGLVAPALDPEAVGLVYALKGRAPEKPCIILISEISELFKFGIIPTKAAATFLSKVWPGPVSVVLPCLSEELAYLHRGTHSLAFRIPGEASLRELLQKAGPLIAPSANPEGQPVAHTIEEARAYFGDKIGEYVDGGFLDGLPSTLVDFSVSPAKLLRHGRGTVREDELS